MNDVAAAVAAHGLATSASFPTAPLDEPDWRALVQRCERDRLIGLLAQAAGDGTLPTSSGQLDELVQLDESWQSSALQLESLLLSVSTTLSHHNVEHRVIKGSALAHRAYPVASHRVMGDIDLLVRSEDFERAKAQLARSLSTPAPLPELRPGFDERFGKDATFRVGNYEIDMHRTLVSGPFGLRLPTEDLFRPAEHFRLGGMQLPTLDAATTFVQVCFNAALGDVPPRLLSLRDVAQVLVTLQPSVHDISEVARRWGAEAVVQRAVQLTWQHLKLETTPDILTWSRAYHAPRLDRLLLEASVSTQRSYTRQVASLAVIRGVRNKASYARAILSPQNSYLEARGWTRGGHVRRAADRLRTARSEQLDIAKVKIPLGQGGRRGGRDGSNR